MDTALYIATTQPLCVIGVDHPDGTLLHTIVISCIILQSKYAAHSGVRAHLISKSLNVNGLAFIPQTYYTLRLIICLLISRNFPISRSAWPLYLITMNEWYLCHNCVHIIYRSDYTNLMT